MTRQYVQLLALFSNWDKYTDALETSRNAMGTLQEQQDTYMEGTKSLLKQLKAAQEDLYDSLIKPEDIEGVVSVIIDITKAVTTFVDTLGGGMSVLKGLGLLAVQVFSRQIANSIAISITNMRNLNENSRKLAAQMEILERFKGANINDPNTQRLIQMKEQMLQYKAVLTAQQQQEADALINSTNEIQNQRAAWEQNKQAAQDFYELQTGRNVVISQSMGKTITDEIKADLRDIQQHWVGATNAVDNYNRAVRAMDRADLAQEENNNESSMRNFGNAVNRVNEILDIYNAELTEMLDSNRLAGPILSEVTEAVRNFETVRRAAIERVGSEPLAISQDLELREAAQRLVETWRRAGLDIQRQINDTTSVINRELAGQTRSLEEAANRVANAHQNIIRGAGLQLTLNQFTQLVGTIGQASFALNSFINLFRTWQDEDIGTNQKILTTFMIMGTTLPTLIASYNRLNELFGTTNTLVGYNNLLKQRNNVLDIENVANQVALNTAMGLNLTQRKDLVASILQRITAERLEIATMTEAQGIEMINTALQERGIVLNEMQVEMLWKKIAAETAASKSTSKLTLLTKAFNASLLANPIVGTIALLSGLVFTFNAVTGAIERAKEARIELLEKERDEAKAAAEEDKRIRELYETYQSFYATYTQTGENKDDLKTATEALCSALNIEIDTLDLLSDSYDNINDKILAYMKVKNKEAVESANLGKLSTGYALLEEGTVGNINEIARRGISIRGGKSGLNKYDEEISNYFEKNLNELVDQLDLFLGGYSDRFAEFDYQGRAVEFGRIGSLNIFGIEDPETLIKVRENLQETYDFLKKEFADEPEVILRSQLFKNIGKFLEDTEDNVKAYIQFEEDIRDSLISSAETILKEEENIDISDIKKPEDFKQYREKYIKALKEVYSDQGIEKSDEEIEKIAKQYYFNKIDALSAQERDYQLEKEMHERFQNSKKEIDDFIKELRDKEEIELAIKIVPQGGETIDEFRDRLTEEYAYYYTNSAQEIQTALNSMAKEKKTQKELKEENELLDALERKYAQYFTTLERGSHEYLSTLREIKEHEETLAMEGLQATKRRQTRELEESLEILDIYKDYAEKGGIQPIDVPGFEEALEKVENNLEELADTEYRIKLQIDADLETDIDDAFGLASEFEELRDIINDDLYYTLEEAQDLINRGYGALFENSKEYIEGISEDAKTAAETVIAVNEDTMNSFIDSRQAELEADRQAKIAQLEMQKTLIDAQRNALRSKLEALQAAASAESDVEAAAAMQRAVTAEAEYQAATERLNKELTNESDAANEKQDINKTLFDALGGMYDQNSANYQQAEIDATTVQQREINTRLKNVQLLSAAYSALGNVIKAAMQGESLGEIGVGSAGGAGGLKQSKSKEMLTKKTTAKELSVDDLSDYVKDLYNNNRKEYDATTKALLEETENRLKSADAQYGAADAAISALNSANLNLDRTQGLATPGGRGKGGGGGKEKKEKEPDTIDLLEEELDRYHDINLELEELENNLDRLNKQQEKLYGKELIDNLNEQLNILEKQKKAYEEKLSIAQEEKREIGDFLSGQGVIFDEEGYIDNYKSAMNAKLNYVNTIINQYNAMNAEQQKTFKDTVEQAKKDYETFKDKIERYDELVSSFMPEIIDSIQDATNEEIEININKFTMEVELRLDMAEAERDFNEFRRKVIDQVKDDEPFGEGILKNAEAKLRDVYSYFRLDPEVVEKYGKFFNLEDNDYLKLFNSKQEEINSLTSEIEELEIELNNLANQDDWEAWDELTIYVDSLYNKISDLEDEMDSLFELDL